MFCYRHPDIETRLRCSRCENPICVKCAIKTPTGYRCPDCVRSQQKIFETATATDYVVAITLAGFLSLIGSFIASAVGFFTIFIAPVAGVIIAETVRWATRRRRSKLLFQLTTAAAAAGSLPLLVTRLAGVLLLTAMGDNTAFMFFLPIIWQGLYTAVVISTVFYRMSGVRLRR